MEKLNLCKKCKTPKSTFVFGYEEKFCSHVAKQKAGTKRAVMARRLFLDNAFK